MLGPPLHDGLYSMAWTVFDGRRCFLDFAGVLMQGWKNYFHSSRHIGSKSQLVSRHI